LNYTGDYVANYKTIFIYRLSLPSKKNNPLKGALKDSNNQYLTVSPEGAKPLKVSGDSTSAETFTILPLGKDLVAIRTQGNKILSCDLNNGGLVTASTDWIADWEIFKLVKNDDGTISLKGANNKFITAAGDNIEAKSELPGPSERFKLIFKY
jgi:hypothetical protein